MVTSVEDNDVNLTTSNSLEIESNWFDHDFILDGCNITIFRFENENSDILHLEFPSEGLERIHLVRSNLSRCWLYKMCFF